MCCDESLENSSSSEAKSVNVEIEMESSTKVEEVKKDPVEINSQNAIDDPLTTLKKFRRNRKNCDEVGETLQEMKRREIDKEEEKNGKICSSESLENRSSTDAKSISDVVADMESSKEVEEMKEDRRELNSENAVEDTSKTLLLQIKEEPPELSSRIADEEPSSVQICVKEIPSPLFIRITPDSDIQLKETQSQEYQVLHPGNVSMEREVNLCADNEGNNTVVDYNKAVRCEEIENKGKDDSTRTPLSAHLKINGEKTEESSVCAKTFGRVLNYVSECDEVVKSKGFENAEIKVDSLSQSPHHKLIGEGTNDTSIGSYCIEKESDPCRPESLLNRENDFWCEICHMCFQNKTDLSVHKRIHSKDQECNPSIQSDELVSSCKKENEVDTPVLQMRIKSNSGVITHECPVCSKNFGRKYSLRRHLLTHSGTNFKCVLCLTCFKSKEDLYEHMRSHSIVQDSNIDVETDKIISVKSEIEVETPFVSKPAKTNNGGISYECPGCLKDFRRKYDCRRHLLTHSGVNFQCVVCQAYCNNKENLFDHIREHSMDNLVRNSSIQSDNVVMSDKHENDKTVILSPPGLLSANTGMPTLTYEGSTSEHVQKQPKFNQVDSSDIQSDNVVKLDKSEDEEIEIISQSVVIGTNISVQTNEHKGNIIEHMRKLQRINQVCTSNVQSNKILMHNQSESKNIQTKLQLEVVQTIPGVQTYTLKLNEPLLKHPKGNQNFHQVVKTDKIEVLEKGKTEKQESLSQPRQIQKLTGVKTDEKPVFFSEQKGPKNNPVSDHVLPCGVLRTDKRKNENLEILMQHKRSTNIEVKPQENQENLSDLQLKDNLTNPNVQIDGVKSDDRNYDIEKTISLPPGIRIIRGVQAKEQNRSFPENMQKYSKENRPFNPVIQPNKVVEPYKNEKGNTTNPECIRINKVKTTFHGVKSITQEGDDFHQNLSEHIKTQFQCDVCSTRFKHKSSLDIHMQKHSSNYPFQCNVCNKSFSEDRQLVIHLRTHTGTKPYECDVCNEQFSQYAHLHIHMRLHSGDKPHACHVCDYSFSMLGNLIAHMRTHTKEKPYVCDICGKNFALNGDLKRHSRIHAREKPFQCDMCEKSFTHRIVLQRHLRIHHDEKPYQCNVCDKRFTVCGNLQTHMQKHIGERLFKCDMCSKSFTQLVVLERHVQTHFGDRPFKCLQCYKRFAHKPHLMHHALTHKGEKPYK